MDPTEALQKAVYECLVADDAISALIGGRVYDHVPADAVFPYVSFGPVQCLDDSVDCIDGSEIYVTLDAWSQEIGSVQARRLAGAIKVALGDGAALDLAPHHRLVEFSVPEHRVERDPDGVTTHAIITLRALTEPD